MDNHKLKYTIVISLLFTLSLGCSDSSLRQQSNKKIEFYAKLAEIVPEARKADFYGKLATVYEEAGNRRKAEELRKKFWDGLKAASSKDEIVEGYSPGYYKTIISLCDEFIATDPTLVPAYLKKASSCMALNDAAGAFEAVNKAIDLEPENPDAYALRSSMYKKTGQMSKADMDEQKAIELEMKKHSF